MPARERVSYANFKKDINHFLNPEGNPNRKKDYMYEVGQVLTEFRPYINARTGNNIAEKWTGWISEIKENVGDDWETVRALSPSIITDMKGDGNGKIDYAIAAHYRFHCEFENLHFARRLDHFIFGNSYENVRGKIFEEITEPDHGEPESQTNNLYSEKNFHFFDIKNASIFGLSEISNSKLRYIIITTVIAITILASVLFYLGKSKQNSVLVDVQFNPTSGFLEASLKPQPLAWRKHDRSFRHISNFDQRVRVYAERIQEAKNSLNPSNSEISLLYSLMGEALLWSNPRTAPDVFAKAVALNPKSPTAHHGLARAYMNVGQVELAVSSFQQAAKLLDRGGPRDRWFAQMALLQVNYLDGVDNEQIIGSFRNLETEAESIGELELKEVMGLEIGAKLEYPKQAIIELESRFGECDSINTNNFLGFCYRILGIQYSKLGEIDKSLQFHQKALKHFDDTKNLVAVSQQMILLAEHHLDYGNPLDAEPLLTAAYIIAEEIGLFNAQVDSAYALASFYVDHIENDNLSLQYSLKVVELAKESNRSRYYITSLFNAGMRAMELRDYPLASGLFEEVLPHFNSNSENWEIVKLVLEQLLNISMVQGRDDLYKKYRRSYIEFVISTLDREKVFNKFVDSADFFTRSADHKGLILFFAVIEWASVNNYHENRQFTIAAMQRAVAETNLPMRDRSYAKKIAKQIEDKEFHITAINMFALGQLIEGRPMEAIATIRQYKNLWEHEVDEIGFELPALALVVAHELDDVKMADEYFQFVKKSDPKALYLPNLQNKLAAIMFFAHQFGEIDLLKNTILLFFIRAEAQAWELDDKIVHGLYLFFSNDEDSKYRKDIRRIISDYYKGMGRDCDFCEIESVQ